MYCLEASFLESLFIGRQELKKYDILTLGALPRGARCPCLPYFSRVGQFDAEWSELFW